MVKIAVLDKPDPTITNAFASSAVTLPPHVDGSDATAGGERSLKHYVSSY